MKSFIQNIVLILFVSFYSCESLKLPMSGEVTQFSGCKNLDTYNVKGLIMRVPAADTLSCAEFIYDEPTETLLIKQENAGFNCCPGEITCNVSQQADTIVIKTMEKEAKCNCNCLYDIVVKVENITPAKYVIRFSEQYAANMEKLIFNIDLKTQKSGYFCVLRKSYPWGLSVSY